MELSDLKREPLKSFLYQSLVTLNYIDHDEFAQAVAAWVTGGPDVVCVNNMDKMRWVVETPMN